MKYTWLIVSGVIFCTYGITREHAPKDLSLEEISGFQAQFCLPSGRQIGDSDGNNDLNFEKWSFHTHGL